MNDGIEVIPSPSVGPDPAGLAANVAAAFGAPPPAKPSPYDDDTKLLKCFNDFKEESFDQRSAYERTWWGLLLYFMGRQWIYYDQGRSSWQDKRLAKWIPRPVTNKIEETVFAILSVFQSVMNGVDCQPAGNDPIDVTAAETANKYEMPVRDEHRMDRKDAEADFWLIVTGNVLRHVWWNKEGSNGTVTVPFEQCTACSEVFDPLTVEEKGGACPACGGTKFQPATAGETFEVGKGCTDVVSPFEVAFPLTYTSFDELPGLIRKRWRTKAWCKRNYPSELVEKLAWESMSNDRSLQLLHGLATMTSVPNGGATNAGTQGDMGKSEGITEYELWLKPTREYPEGLLLRVVGEGQGGKVLRLPDQSIPGPLPYKTVKGEPIFPWIHTGYNRVAGRIWARSPLESLIQKQDQINQLDSLIQLIVQRCANPIWLEPKGTDVRRLTGEPGLVVQYTPSLAGANAKPERIEGQNVPGSLFQLREQYLTDIENMAGTYDIIKGSKPTGVEAFSALQLLVERSQSRYGPVLSARGDSYRQWFSIALELERQYGPKERLYSVLGPNQRWTQQVFQQADLQGAIRILVQDGSQTPKTSLGKRAAIEQLSNLGVIDPKNPDTAYEILRVFGQTSLWPGLDFDVKSALQEQYDFEQWAAAVQFMPQAQPAVDPMTGLPAVDPMTGAPAMQQVMMPSLPPPGLRKVWHNDAVHAAEHRKWANGDSVRQMLAEKPEIEQYVDFMIQQHDMALAEQAAQQQMAAAGGKSPGGMAMENSNQESGKPGGAGLPGQGGQ